MAAKQPKTGADALDDVYLGDFEGFVARRDALAKQLRADGDGEEADRVKALKKPSRTAWAVNQFAAHGKKLRTELLKAGGQLREASEGLVSGDADREAMLKARDRERAAVGAALEAIAALAAESGPELNAAAGERVRQTLHAVALDEDVREQFEAARLTTDQEASGLGGGLATAAGAGSAKTRRATATAAEEGPRPGGRAQAPPARRAEGRRGRGRQARPRPEGRRPGAGRGEEGRQARPG